MAFRELFISAGQDGIFETHMLTISKLNKVLKEVTKDPIVRGKFAHCPAQDLLRKRSENMNFTQPEQTLVPDEDEVEEGHDQPPPAPPQPNNGGAGGAQGGPPAPPPPPPAPLPPRPGFWRFPGAEFSGKGLRR